MYINGWFPCTQSTTQCWLSLVSYLLCTPNVKGFLYFLFSFLFTFRKGCYLCLTTGCWQCWLQLSEPGWGDEGPAVLSSLHPLPPGPAAWGKIATLWAFFAESHLGVVSRNETEKTLQPALLRAAGGSLSSEVWLERENLASFLPVPGLIQQYRHVSGVVIGSGLFSFIACFKWFNTVYSKYCACHGLLRKWR